MYRHFFQIYNTFSNIFYNDFITYYHNTFFITIFMFELKKESLEYENKSLRLPKELIERVQTLANENNMSFNKVVIQYIDYAAFR